MHKLLAKQIEKAKNSDGSINFEKAFAQISEAYFEMDRDRRRTDRSITLMVEELDDLNRNLEAQVERRTEELKSVSLVLDATLQNSEQGIIIVDKTNRVQVCNSRAMSLLDLPPKLMWSRPTLQEMLDYQWSIGEFTNVSEKLQRMMQIDGLEHSPPIFERVRPNGTILEVHTVMLAEGGVMRTFTDITTRRRREIELNRALAEHSSLFENALVGIYRATLDGEFLRVNPALAKMMGFKNESAMLDSMRHESPWRYVEPGRQDLLRERLFVDGAVTDFVSELEHVSSRQRMWISETAWLIRDENDLPLHYEGTIIDTTERKTSEARISYLATHDSLTHLPNRRHMLEQIKIALMDIEPDETIAIHCLDLDRFKEVNDSLGHAAGDRLLRVAAQRLARCVRPGDIIARLGGDEFAVLQRHVKDEQSVSAMAERIINRLGAEYRLGAHFASVGVTVGIAFGPRDGLTANDLLKSADMALYAAKEEGRGRYRQFDNELNAKALRRHKILVDLRNALTEKALTVAYQPVVSLEDRSIHGFEALVRWTNNGEMIPPAEFIPIAEEAGLIDQLGEYVLQEACETIARAGGNYSIAVNLSPLQLKKRGLARTVVNALVTSGLSPQRLILEVTESVLLSDSDITRDVLNDLRVLGVRIALDDFGAGYSSLTYLQQFQFDCVKIDRTFISGKEQGNINVAVINAVVGLGRDLGISIVAEGVETEAQLDWLKAMGCDQAQGYFLGRPLPADQWPQLNPNSKTEDDKRYA